jgi:hypothetical protein
VISFRTIVSASFILTDLPLDRSRLRFGNSLLIFQVVRRSLPHSP